MASSCGNDLIKLAAAGTVAGTLGFVIINPQAPSQYSERLANAAPAVKAATAERPCPVAGSILDQGFAPLQDVISVSPLGSVTAPGEALPAPFIRVNTKKGATVFERRATMALAPARAEIEAIERRVQRDSDGAATGLTWRVTMSVCDAVKLYYDDIDVLSPDLMRKAGGLAAFSEVSGPDRMAVKTSIRVQTGDTIGEADGFDIGLEDSSLAPADLVRPERYKSNPYVEARVLNTDAGLIKAIDSDATLARCPLDYLPTSEKTAWSALLGDQFGIRKVRTNKDPDACRQPIVDKRGTAQGAWFTDASQNGAANKVSAIALAPDSIDPQRLIFSLHGRLTSLTPGMVALPPKMTDAKAEAAKDFLSFYPGERAGNPTFAGVEKGEIACFDRLRANFVGPRINGVILLQVDTTDEGAEIMRMEARGEATSCSALESPWGFTPNHTVFYR